jgi:hypothetical protein
MPRVLTYMRELKNGLMEVECGTVVTRDWEQCVCVRVCETGDGERMINRYRGQLEILMYYSIIG